jgi:hypothetical protein
MLLQSFLRSHFPLLGCPDDLCYVRVVDYSHTDKVTPRKVFAPPAVIQPIDARFWTSRARSLSVMFAPMFGSVSRSCWRSRPPML